MNIESQKIIDAHHHLWDPTSEKYDWLTAPGHEVFNKIYLHKDFETDIGDINLIKSVHIQAEINLPETIYETQWLQEHYENTQTSSNTSLPNAIIGFVDFIDTNAEHDLQEHLKYANFNNQTRKRFFSK